MYWDWHTPLFCTFCLQSRYVGLGYLKPSRSSFMVNWSSHKIYKNPRKFKMLEAVWFKLFAGLDTIIILVVPLMTMLTTIYATYRRERFASGTPACTLKSTLWWAWPRTAWQPQNRGSRCGPRMPSTCLTAGNWPLPPLGVTSGFTTLHPSNVMKIIIFMVRMRRPCPKCFCQWFSRARFTNMA